MSIRGIVSKLVTASVKPVLAPAGFRKTGLIFERRCGEATHLVGVQCSHGGSNFYIDVGVVLNAITALGPNTTGASRIGPHVIHHGGRLEDFVPNLPASWDPAHPETGIRVGAALTELLPLLDRIDGARGLREAFPLDRGFEKVLRAQLRSILGDGLGARSDLAAVAAEFVDRNGLTIERLARNAGIESVLEIAQRTN